MENREHKKGDQCLRYTFEHWKRSKKFEIINDISEYINLVQLLDTVGNFIHSVSISGNRIFDSNYIKALALAK